MVALCVVVVAFVGVPSLKQIQGMRGQGRSAAEYTAEATRAHARRASLQKEITGLQAEVRSLTWSEEPSRLPARILVELDAIASRAGITMTTLRPGRPAPAPCGTKLPFLVQVRAPYPRAAAFLHALSASLPRVALERIQMASTDSSTDEVSLELRLAVYCSRPPQK